MSEIHDLTNDDGRTADDYPLEASPSTDTYAVAELNHAPEAHKVSEYHEPPVDLEVIDAMLQDSSTLEVAL